MILKLRVENWGHFDSYELNFERGANCLFGANQSGKTTLLNAIYFGLTGKPLSIKTKARNYVKIGSKKSKVELDLEIKGNQYRIIRDGLRSASLFEINGEMIGEELESGVKDVKSKMMDLIDSGASFIDDWVFFREGEISHFLQTSTPANRRKTVSGFVNVNSYQEIEKVAGGLLTPLKSEGKFIKDTLAQTTYLTDKIGDTDLKQLRLDKDRIEKQLESARKNERKSELETQLKESSILSKREKKLSEKIAALKRKLDEASSTKLADLAAEEGSLSGKLETLQNNLNLLTRQIEQATCPTCGEHISPQKMGKIVSTLENEIGRVKNLKKGYAKKMTRLEEEIESEKTHRSRISSLERELTTVQVQIENMASLEEELQIIKDQIGDDVDLDLVELRTRLSSLEQDIIDMQIFDGHRKEIERNQTKLENIERKRYYLELLQSGARHTIEEIGRRTLELVQDDTGALIEKLKLFKTGKLDIQSEYLMPTCRMGELRIEFANLSASEKLICLISMRISLIKKLSSLDFIVLDDPALQLDDEHTKLLADHFRKCGIGQVILSSSKPGLRDEVWDNLVSLSN